MISLDEFRKTRRRVDDVYAVIWPGEEDSDPRPGFVYWDDSCYIEDYGGPLEGYQLTLHGSTLEGHCLTLDEAEARLYVWLCEQEITVIPTVGMRYDHHRTGLEVTAKMWEIVS